jgi:hypothetical protein
MEPLKKRLAPVGIYRALSTVFVEMERTLKNDPKKSVEDFCKGLPIHPIDILYSDGFQVLIIFAALVPLKEALDQPVLLNSSQALQDEWEKLRIARNAICHGSYEFLKNGKVRFQDLRNKSVEMEPREIINLSNKLVRILFKSLS